MGVLDKFFGSSPFIPLHEHSKKVHQCVKLMRPLVDALFAGDYDKIDELQNEMSRTEHQADQVKTELRDQISKTYFLSVGRQEMSQFLAYQDDIADAAEDFAVVLTLRKTEIPEELRKDFSEFVDQVINVVEHLLSISEELCSIAEAGFSGQQVQKVLEDIKRIGEEEWHCDRMERKFARHFYQLEDKLDIVTIIFLEKYCSILSSVANNAERTAKYLRLLICKK